MKWPDLYHGWLIELIPFPEGYAFKCWMPDEQIGISNNHIYPRLYQAMQAARTRAKLESANLAIVRFLNESYANCMISCEEHLALVNSIYNFTISVSNFKKINF
jgi:hypothetical protein